MTGLVDIDRRQTLVLMAAAAIGACSGASARQDQPRNRYRWRRILDAAPYPKSYNYPVHVLHDGRFVALHPAGTWSSRDGIRWQREPLDRVPTNSAYLGVVQHGDASVALGRHTGNYLGFTVDRTIWRTRNYRAWEAVSAPALPGLIFYAAASFGGRIWMLGGHDGRGPVNQVWSSLDGVDWQAMPTPPWSPRARAVAVVFHGRLLLIGGGAIDGEPGSDTRASEVWATADGRGWEKLAGHVGTPDPVGFVPQVFDGRLWLVGANRSGAFASEMIVSDDGQKWLPVTAPWSARGAMATWTDGGGLFMTGGKSSRVIDGETVFEYSNDVWVMTRA